MARELEQHKSKSTSEPEHANKITLKGTCLLATKSDMTDFDASNSVCYATKSILPISSKDRDTKTHIS